MIDTHLHLVDRARLDYPWLGDAPALNRDWTYDAYAATARPRGITGVLHMEVDVAPTHIGAETEMVAELMQAPDSLILGAISAARPEDAGFAAFLERLDRATVKGIRRVLHVVPDDLSTSDRFRDNIRRLGAAGLPFDICMLARQLPLARALVDSAPNTVFVLDHCGVPDISGDAFDQWAKEISDLARRPNVKVKLSGLPSYARANWSPEDLRPYVDHVIAAFGWDRVVWGSDSPVCTLNGTLAGWIDATEALTADASDSERARLFEQNARRIWSL